MPEPLSTPTAKLFEPRAVYMDKHQQRRFLICEEANSTLHKQPYFSKGDVQEFKQTLKASIHQSIQLDQKLRALPSSRSS